jgi:hypothetical protein
MRKYTNDFDRYKFADLLLRFLAENKGTKTVDQISIHFIDGLKYSLLDYFQVRDMLIELDLIEQFNDDYRVRLTDKGWKAVKIGIKKYLKRDENKKKGKWIDTLLGKIIVALLISLSIYLAKLAIEVFQK